MERENAQEYYSEHFRAEKAGGRYPFPLCHAMIYFWLILALFTGYASGRIGHILGGQLGKRGVHIGTPHHWVYGVVVIMIGAIFFQHEWGKSMIAFGLGHVVSDLNDLFNRRVFDSGAEPEVKKFWGID